MSAVLYVPLGFAALFVLLVLAGVASAAWEVRAERRAGLPVTRPAWDNRAERRRVRAEQGRAPYLRGLVKGLRS